MDRATVLRRLRQIAHSRDLEKKAAREAIAAGVPQKDVADALGRTREWVRRAQKPEHHEPASA